MIDRLSDVTHVGLGGAITFVIVATALNLDWRHYIRYWVGPTRRYSRQTSIVFRVIFFAIFLASIHQLFKQAAASAPSLSDAPYIAIDAIVFLAIGLAMDGIFRSIWGRPGKQY